MGSDTRLQPWLKSRFSKPKRCLDGESCRYMLKLLGNRNLTRPWAFPGQELIQAFTLPFPYRSARDS